MAQFLSEERRELDVPPAEDFMADLNAALVQQFLDIALAEGKPVVKPEGLLNDAERKTVTVSLRSVTEDQPSCQNPPSIAPHFRRTSNGPVLPFLWSWTSREQL